MVIESKVNTMHVIRSKLPEAGTCVVLGAMLLPIVVVASAVACTEPCETRDDTARTQAAQIAASLEVYRLQKGAYPSTLRALMEGVMDRLPRDPWNNDFLFACPGIKNPTKCDVRSRGADGALFTEDDVGNWPLEDE